MKTIVQLIGVALMMFALVSAYVPGPGPNPIDPVDPVDPVDPAPFPVDELAVLIVEESTERSTLPQAQLDIFTAGQVWMDQNGIEGMILDPDTQGVNMPPWREAFAVPRQSVPWIVISNGRSGTSEPLPQSLEAFKELVGRFD